MTSGTDPDSPAAGSTVPDGQMEFANYSDAQLQDLRMVLDAQRYPLNAAHLQGELDRRADLSSAVREPAEPPGTDRVAPLRDESGNFRSTYPVRFTERDGWRGWLNAKRRRQPFYAAGSVTLQPEEVVLEGWCRSWLAMSERGELRIARERIRNVAASGAQVSFEYRRLWRLRRRLNVQCESAEAAAELVRALPSERTAGFQQKWQALQEFSRRLDALGVRPWVTLALVVLNVLVFALVVILNQGWTGVTWQAYIRWGANFGPLTTGGQWWRLLTSLFLHGGLWHLLVNMWVLWNAGRLTERLYGNGRYALIWFGSGLAASMASVVWDPTRVSIGASGAIFGVLGAFLAHALKPGTRLPRRILLIHWLSTAVFALFSLANGWFDQGIDNAAHAGGLLMGVILGLFLSEPLPTERSTPASARWQPVALSMLCAVTYLGLGYMQIHGVGTRLTGPTSYSNAHSDFAKREEVNLRRWGEIGQQLAAGVMSPAEAAREFRADIVPFWVQTLASMTKELPKIPREQRLYAEDVVAYVRERLAWANELVDEVASNSAISGDVMQAHLAKLTKALARLERRRMDADATLAPRALARSPTVNRLRHLFGGEPPCVDPPAWTGRLVGAKDNPADGPAQRRAIRCAAQQAFLAQDFKSLEDTWHRFPSNDTDPIEGETRHNSLLRGLDDLFEYGSVQVTDALATLANWRRQYPESLLPALVEASLYEDWAWSARGHGGAKDTAQQQWQLFGYRSVMASAALEEAQPQGGSEPEWYVLRLGVGLDLSEDKDALTDIFNTAMDQYSTYLPLIRARLRILMPRWSGSFEDVDRLINTQAQRWGNEAPEIYARLYASYASLEGDETSFYSEGKMEWARMQEGFDALLRRYPNSDALLNDYAYLACRANEPGVYQSLRNRLEGHVASTAWTGEHTLAQCDKLMH
jgi:membrane associated rhomboid family serine protease